MAEDMVRAVPELEARGEGLPMEIEGQELANGGKPALVNCTGGDIYYPFANIPQQDNFTLAGTHNESFRPYLTYHGCKPPGYR